MLITSKNFLNDGFLPWAEAKLKHHHDHIEPIYETYRLFDHADLVNLHKRSGQWMHSSELICQVQRLNPRLFVEQQINFPDQWGLYLDVKGRQTYVSGFPKGWLREFTAILVDDRNLQEEYEIRGWRTVLLRMLTSGALTWSQVIHTFGEAEGINNQRWQMYTRMFRGDEASQKISAYHA